MTTRFKKILVVDDDAGIVRLIQQVLLSHGYSVVTAYDGLDALAKIKKEKPDLVVLDIMMPEMNGYDVCYQLRYNKEYDKIPIILLTSRKQEIDDSVGRKVNIEYMSKPADTALLISNVKKLLGEEPKPGKGKA